MDILNSRNVILFNGQEIPLQTVGFPKWALQVTVLEDEIILGMMEKIVDVFADRPDQAYSEKIEENMLVEGNPEFHDKYGCCVVPVMIQIIGQVTAQVWVFNIFPDPVKIQGDDIIGSLSPVQVRRVFQDSEHLNEVDNFSCT